MPKPKGVGRFGVRVQQLMSDHGLMYTDLERVTGKHYEHIRKVVHGYAYPSDAMIDSLAKALKVSPKELKDLVVVDKISGKYGQYLHLLSKKHPELAEIEPEWDRLTAEEKKNVRMMIHMFNGNRARANQNAGLATSPRRSGARKTARR